MFHKSNFKYFLYCISSFIFLSIMSCSEKVILVEAQNLTISEGFKNPLGFYDATPTFSWQLPVSEAVVSQSAYQIVVASNPDLLPENPDLWDSDQQKSAQSTWVKYQGKPLQSRQKVYWQVKYWNQNKEASNWSEINHFELGLLNNTDWQAQWIGLDTKAEGILGSQENIIHRPQYVSKIIHYSKRGF